MVQMVSNAIVPLENVDEIHCWDNRPFTGTWIGCKRDKCKDITRTIKKKPKRFRTAYTTEQIKTLEKIFTENKYITSDRRKEISAALNIGDKSVKIWFQNRRMKEKRESSESSSESCSDTTVSPLSLPQEEMLNPDPECNTNTNGVMFPHQTPGSYQYQFPSFYNEQVQTSYAPCHMPGDGMQFFNDNNVYPTHYYPYDNVNCYERNSNYNQFQQENETHDVYWNVNNLEPCYYYN